MAIDRLIGIIAVLLREERVKTSELARRFEVSGRTIARDIDRLCRAGIPLGTVRGSGGGVFIMEGYAVERTLLTDADRGAVLAGLRSLDSVSGTNYYRQLMEKLPHAAMNTGDDCVVIDLASWYGAALAPRLEQLKVACAESRAVEFTYCSPGGDSRRLVEPYKLVFRWSSWYLYGWCRTREDWRLFKLNRMLDVEVLEEAFTPRPAPDPITPPEQVYPNTLEAVIRFAPPARWRLIDEYGVKSFTVQEDGSLLFQRGFPDKEELFRWLLSFQEQGELLSPQSLREEFSLKIKNICRKYDS